VEDVLTLETPVVFSIMREHLPTLRIRVVNVVNLMKLQSETEHPNGLSNLIFGETFTKDKSVICVFHAYPWLIHCLTHRRSNDDDFHVRGEGTITTAFDITVPMGAPARASSWRPLSRNVSDETGKEKDSSVTRK
jgi:xylulose-5-phosphate/fructose-6-phosphate phosphoketolase